MPNKVYIKGYASLIFGLLLVIGCKPDDLCDGVYDCEPYVFEKPYRFPEMFTPSDNGLTQAKIDLGRLLFYETQLSASGNMSCGSCHQPENSFADLNQAVSINDLGTATSRNASNLLNLAWMDKGLFWDGRVNTLEEAVEDAIINEQHLDWGVSLNALKLDDTYSVAYASAFEDGAINQVNTIKAIASFLRIVVSSNAKIDQFFRGEYQFTPLEQFGFDSIFLTERGDCFHCHGEYPFLTDNEFHNNGLQENVNSINDFADPGLGGFTGLSFDYGKMKTPSLRNLSYTAPYMHDGRFTTIDEVIDFYSSGLHASPNVDPLMKNVNEGGVQLTDYEKEALKAFLLTFDDPDFVSNPNFQNPH